MTNADGAATGSSYKTQTNVTKASSARYTMVTNIPSAGKLAFRTKDNDSGIATTTSGGLIKTVSITACQDDRIVEVYGSNTAYSSPADLFNDALKGTKLGEITSSSSSLDVSGNYAYVGVRSNNNAVSMDSISFTWYVPFPESVSSVALPTKTSLSYSYNKDGGDYEYTSAVVRFAGLISETQWNEIDTGSHVIQGFGVILSTASFLGDQTIKGMYNVVRNGHTIDQALAQLCDGTNVKNFYKSKVEKALPDSANDVQKDGAVGNHYVWYLSKSVVDGLTTSYTAVAYIRIANDIVFFNETTASAKSVANNLIENGPYDASTAGGSLNNLANLA